LALFSSALTIYGAVSGRRYRRTGLVAAQLDGEIIAPLQYDGTMDSTLFEFWLETCLMRELPPSSVIVMDNAAFHRKSRLPLLAQGYGHRLVFLPPYSPELKPIEHFWTWLKRRLTITPCRNLAPLMTLYLSAFNSVDYNSSSATAAHGIGNGSAIALFSFRVYLPLHMS